MYPHAANKYFLLLRYIISLSVKLKRKLKIYVENIFRIVIYFSEKEDKNKTIYDRIRKSDEIVNCYLLTVFCLVLLRLKNYGFKIVMNNVIRISRCLSREGKGQMKFNFELKTHIFGTQVRDACLENSKLNIESSRRE